MNNFIGRHIIIALSGVDGCGKTTQAQKLAKAMQMVYGRDKVAYSHGNRPLFKKDKKGGDFAHYNDRRRNLGLTLGLLAKDLIKIWLFDLPNRGRSVIIFDRFIDDALAKSRFYYRPLPIIEKIARWLSPRASLVIWLDLPPEQSFARDKEYPLAYHEKKRSAYAPLFRLEDSRRIRIDGIGSPDEVFQRIAAAVKERLLL